MKRDMNLIRDILIYIESEHEFNEAKGIDLAAFPEVNSRQFTSHLELIRDAGYLNKVTLATDDCSLAGGISNAGYDFLDSVRDPEIWRDTISVAEKAGGWTIELIGEIAKGFIKTKIKKHTGVET